MEITRGGEPRENHRTQLSIDVTARCAKKPRIDSFPAPMPIS
jgi:hypothetical protein